MIRKITLAILALTITGCAGWKPSGSRGYNDIITNSQVEKIPENEKRLLVVIQKHKLGETIERNADTFAGAACNHSFTIYPLLYANFISKALPIYKEIAVSDKIGDGQKLNYDIAVELNIDDVRWGATGISSNAAALSLTATVISNNQLKNFNAFQVANQNLGRSMNGCEDSKSTTSAAAIKAMELSINRTLSEISKLENQNNILPKNRVPYKKQKELLSAIKEQAERGEIATTEQNALASTLIQIGRTAASTQDGQAYYQSMQSIEKLEKIIALMESQYGIETMQGYENGDLIDRPSTFDISDILGLNTSEGHASDEETINSRNKYLPGGICQNDLSYLSSSLPRTKAREIEYERNKILKASITNMMRMINQSGIPPSEAVKQSLEQAKSHEETAREALATASMVDAFGATDDAFLRAINNGTINVISCEGVRNNSLCAAIVNKYAAIASRALAANLNCHNRNGSWAK